MRKMTVKDIQTVSLEILNDVHKFCVAHDIKYSLAYGTLLGAIRHKGFIPWDDDIDIFMPRVDYERFVREYQFDGKRLLLYNANSGANIAYARVCDMNDTILFFDKISWVSRKTGVYIDVFPLDVARKDTFVKDKRQAMKLWIQTCYQRFVSEPFSSRKGIKERLEWLAKKTIVLTYGKNAVEKQMKLCQKYKSEHTGYLFNFACPDFKEGIVDEKWFEELILVPFEDYEFFIPKRYDEVLVNMFGDYMELPPVEQRCSHTNYIKYYWKNERSNIGY